MTNIAKPIPLASSATFTLGPDAGQPNKVAPGNAYATDGVVPGVAFTAGNENAIRVASNAAITDAQLVTYAQIVAMFYEAHLNFFVHCERTNALVSAEGTTPKAYTPDGRAFLSLSVDSSLIADLTLTAYRNGSLSGGAIAYMLADQPSLQSHYFMFTDDTTHAESNAAMTAAPTVQWIDMCADDGTAGNLATLPVVLDEGGHVYALLLGTWASIASLSGGMKYLVGDNGGTWVFCETSTSVSLNVGGGNTFTTNSPTWDGVALASPQGMICRPCWDAVNARWIVATVDPTSENTHATTGKVWTSTDGFTWITLVATAGLALTSIASVRGWLFATGKVGVHSGAPWTGHGGIEIFISSDGGATWVATGHVLDTTASINAGQLSRRMRVRRAGPYVLAQSVLSGTQRSVVVMRAGA